MDLKHLRYFVEIVDQASFHRASRALGIAQPALSRRMQDLEISLGCKVLNRSVRGVVPTRAGHMLYQEAQEILAKVSDTTALVRGVSESQSGTFRLGLVRSARKYDFVHQALKDISMNDGAGHVVISTGASPRLAADLESGKLDASLIYEQRVDSPLCASRLIHRESYVLGVCPSSPLAIRGPVTLSELIGQQFAWLPRTADGIDHDPLLLHCRSKGIDLTISHVAATQSELIDIVSLGGGLCITPVSTILTVPNGLVAFRAIADLDLTLDLYFCWNIRSPSSRPSDLLATFHRTIDFHRHELTSGEKNWARLDGRVLTNVD
jgi:DNA-binding transcriptional LysR family regulator